MKIRLQHSLLALVALAVLPAPAHAFCAICESPLLTLAINRVTSSVTGAVNNVNLTAGNIVSAVDNNTEHLDRGLSVLSQQSQNTAAWMVKQQGIQRSLEQGIASYDPQGACETANRTEAAGQGLSRQATWATSLAKRTVQRLTGVSNRADATGRQLSLSPAAYVPQFVLSPAGTMDTADLQRAHDFNMNMINPYPPTDPVKLPDKYKARPEAKQYDTLFKLYNQNQMLYAKVINRPLEMMAPSIPATPDMVTEWDQIRGSAATGVMHGSDDPSVIPDQRMALVPVSDGGQSKISELDYIRTEVFKRYANPHYRDKVEAMTDTMLLKELVNVQSIQSRMLYEMMLSGSATAYESAVRGARESNSEYGSKLGSIEASMRANQ